MRQCLQLLTLLACVTPAYAQPVHTVAWSFATEGGILAHPVVEGDVVYFGSNDRSLYAVDVRTGKKRWSHATRAEIRGPVLVHGNVVYLVAGNSVHAVRKDSGKELWTFSSPTDSGAEQLDLWDYHTGSLVIHGSTLFAGLGDGHVYGLDVSSGMVTASIATADAVPVRSGLVVHDSILYFGDWNGKVYAHDLTTGTLLWTYATFEDRPYPTFGPVNTKLVVQGDLLIFGGRNPELQVLDRITGKKKWSYVEKDGGWISGDPLVVGDTLYIGGSDNHEMFAFDVHTGERYWTYEFLYNNFSQPALYEDHLLFTIGDAYTVFGGGMGRGYLYALDRRDGSLRNLAVVGGNVHTTPAIYEGLIIVGSEDGNLYAIDGETLLTSPLKLEDIGYGAGDIVEITPQPFEHSADIRYSVNYPSELSVSITDLADSTIVILFSGVATPGDFAVSWDGTDASGHEVEDGHYFVKLSSRDFYQTAFVQKETSETSAAGDGRATYDGLPMVISNKSSVSIRDGDTFRKDSWHLAPGLKPDIYNVELFDGIPHDVTFYTDVDSIRFTVELGKSYDFIVRWDDQMCYQRLIGQRHVPAAVFDAEYIRERADRIVIDIPAAYELVNVAMAITPFGRQSPNYIYQKSSYYRQVLAWFDRYSGHPFVVTLDSILQSNPGRYADLKMNGNAFVFDDSGVLQRSPIYDRTGFRYQSENSLLPYFDEMRLFAEQSGFLDFYGRHASAYEDQIRVYRDSINVQEMRNWLQRQFPGTESYDTYNIIFSPLVSYNQSTTWFESNGLRELQPHVNFPYRENLSGLLPLSKEAEYIDRGSILFTELNHGYINPEAEKYGARIGAAVSKRNTWVDSTQSASYYAGHSVFNEYLNWGLISLRIIDYVREEEQEKLIGRYERTMVSGRHFPRFREFNRFLMDIYRNRRAETTVADLYPRIIEWFEANNR